MRIPGAGSGLQAMVDMHGGNAARQPGAQGRQGMQQHVGVEPAAVGDPAAGVGRQQSVSCRAGNPREKSIGLPGVNRRREKISADQDWRSVYSP